MYLLEVFQFNQIQTFYKTGKKVLQISKQSIVLLSIFMLKINHLAKYIFSKLMLVDKHN